MTDNNYTKPVFMDGDPIPLQMKKRIEDGLQRIVCVPGLAVPRY